MTVIVFSWQIIFVDDKDNEVNGNDVDDDNISIKITS